MFTTTAPRMSSAVTLASFVLPAVTAGATNTQRPTMAGTSESHLLTNTVTGSFQGCAKRSYSPEWDPNREVLSTL